MADDKRLEYLDAKKELDINLEKFNALRNKIKSVYDNFIYVSSLADQPVGNTSSPTISMGYNRTPLIKGVWPTFEEIKECVELLQKSNNKAEQLFKQLSDDDKKNVTPPHTTVEKYNLRSY